VIGEQKGYYNGITFRLCVILVVADMAHKALDFAKKLGHEVCKYVHGRRNIQPMKQSIIALSCFKSALLLTGVLTLTITLASGTEAMGGSNIQDMECLQSETLRVEIGGETFAFPRKMVRSLGGSDVKDVRPNYAQSSGSKACQMIDDSSWRLNFVALDLYALPCRKKKDECSENMVSAYLEDLVFRDNGSAINVFPQSKEALLEKCIAPKKPSSPWHSKVWSMCNYTFENEGFHVWLKFRGGIYPPEGIERTKQLVLDEIYKYKTENNISNVIPH